MPNEEQTEVTVICDVFYELISQNHECKIRDFGLMQLKENLLQFLIEGTGNEFWSTPINWEVSFFASLSGQFHQHFKSRFLPIFFLISEEVFYVNILQQLPFIYDVFLSQTLAFGIVIIT